MRINLEYRKGILFIRLIGELTKETIHQLEHKIDKIVKENQMTNIVLNIERLYNIDMKGINYLFYIYELSRKNKGKTLICGVNNEIKNKIKKRRLLNYIKEIENELVAFELIIV